MTTVQILLIMIIAILIITRRSNRKKRRIGNVGQIRCHSPALSLEGAATNIIFVATKMILVAAPVTDSAHVPQPRIGVSVDREYFGK